MPEQIMRAALALALTLAASASLAQGKPATCFTTDDGRYPCTFRALDRAGSFEISAAGRPTYTLDVAAPGRAYGFANFGDRNVSLPGEYVRSAEDGACWDNADTQTRICAW